MWETMTLEKVCKIISGNSIPAKKKEEYYTDVKGMPYVATKDVGFDGAINYENGIFIPDEYLSGFKISPAFATLVCAEGGSAGRKIAFSTEECCFVNKLFSLQPNENIIPKFIYYYTLGTEFQSQFKEAMHGLIGGVSLSKIKDFYISIPPLAEQQRIVTKLDAAFAEIDKLKTCALAQSTQVQLLTERVLSEQTTADDELVQLSDVCGIESGLIDPKIFPYKEQIHVGAGNIVSSSNELIELKTAEQEKLTSGKYPFDETTVLYSKIRPYLKKVHLPNFKGICSADMYPLKPNSEKLDREYLFYVLLSENFTNYAIAGSARAGMPKVNRNHLFAYPFRLPTLDKQKNIIKALNTAFTSKSELEEIIQRKIAAIDSLKSAVLTQELQSEAA